MTVMSLQIDTDLTVNLLAHIYGAAGLLGNSEYMNLYVHTLEEDQLNWLKALSEHFRLRPPIAASPLFIILFQMPGYFDAYDEKGLNRVFELVQGFLSKGVFATDKLKHETVGSLGLWIPDEIVSYSFSAMDNRGRLREVIEGLKDIALDEYRGYYSEKWRVLEEELLEHCEDLEAELAGLDLLGAWSEATGMKFPYRRFRVRLCEALKGCTSLLAEKIALPSSAPLERAVEIIIHEAGIHFIAPKHYIERGVTPEYFMRNQERFSRYEEAAICHLKERMYRGLGLTPGPDYHIPLMGIEKEMKKIEQLWEKEEPKTVIDGILAACLSG